MAHQSIPIVKKFGLSCNGFITTYIGNTSLYVAAGVCRDSNNVVDIVIGGQTDNSPETISPVLLDATKNGINGLDQGVLILNTVYAIYVIGDSSGYNAAATLLAQENSDPLMPAGYDSKRLISYVSTDGSAHIRPFYQYGTGEDRSIVFTGTPILSSSVISTVPAFGSLFGVVPNRSNSITLNLMCYYQSSTPGNVFTVLPNLKLTAQVASIMTSGQFTNVSPSYDSGNVSFLSFVQTLGDEASVYAQGFNFSV